MKLRDNRDGTYTCSYTPKSGGRHAVQVSGGFWCNWKSRSDMYYNQSISVSHRKTILLHLLMEHTESVVIHHLKKNNEISGKGKYVMAYLATVGCYGMICVMGQYLVNTSENLWNAIASNPWQNKPTWFKHGIKMLLIGTQKPLKMEPAGLYVLDLNFLLKVLQVSYSYCNLMLQFNNKKEKDM
ncbi:uncharacterized protein LOC142331231 [Lycorma delicatula]|uniref:uncharacterized protein LOC142331231 n=1 Tax=Lycorma delicatula TaxID=130591 RepID=UPI003F513F95